MYVSMYLCVVALGRHNRLCVSSCCVIMTASEAPPKNMLHVLRERWGADPHLAHALVAHYGGHCRSVIHSKWGVLLLRQEAY